MENNQNVDEQFNENTIQALIPYEQLVSLLGAAGEVIKLRNEVKRLKKQIDALRGIQLEIMEKFDELD